MEKNKIKKNTTYKILRPILMVLFKGYFNPKKTENVNIPSEGPIILCANHINAHDQFMALYYTKRIVHYIAKKEYFDGKTGGFFRAVGCIPVDRSIKDENAKSEALDVLNNGGAIGLFPEGTRNTLVDKKERLKELYKLYEDEYDFKKFRKILKKKKTRISQIDLLNKLLENKKITKEEYKKYVLNADKSLINLKNKNIISEEEYNKSLLLPFKFGAVSMAKKTNATIVPFACSDNYKFRSKNLRIKFGETFKVGDMELEEANNKLFNIIDNLILDLKKDK